MKKLFKNEETSDLLNHKNSMVFDIGQPTC